MQVTVVRKGVKFLPDPSRIIARFHYTSDERSKDIILNVLAMPDNEVNAALNKVLRGYSIRHRNISPVSYTHLRAHETVLDLVCRLLLEKKKKKKNNTTNNKNKKNKKKKKKKQKKKK